MKFASSTDGRIWGSGRVAAVYAILAVGTAILAAGIAGGIDRQLQMRSIQALLDAEMLAGILSHDWPGNVREIRNAAERHVIGLPIFDDAESAANDSDVSLPDRVAAYEKRLIEGALRRSRGSIKAAMETLGVPHKTLQDKMTKYGVRREEFLGGNPPTAD